MDDIDYEQLQQEDMLWPWINDPSEEPGDYEWTHEEDE
jgi:hypothetical protein